MLSRSSRRLAAMHPVTVEADVMKPLPVEGRFDSAALSFVLHCLRGPQSHKSVAIRNIADVLAPMACFSAAPFWASLNDTRLRLARSCAPPSRKGDFDNLGNTALGLRKILEESFEAVEVDVVGSTANFTATGPRSAREGAGSL